MPISTRYTPVEAARLPLPVGRLSAQMFETADLELRHYAPAGVDNQVPHDRDELYVVISGRGWFEREGEKLTCAAGDVLFAAAGERHRFVDFTSDFATWVIFYGPKRGGAG